jgi:hypothetical protein
MSQRTGAGEPRDVAVGATREEAAGTFGEYFDDAFFTSYEDFDAEVDLSLLRSLGLVAGDGLTAVLPRVLTGHNEVGGSPRVLVGLPPEVPLRDTAEEVLASYPGLTFTRVLYAGDSVLLPLERVAATASQDRDAVLDLLTPPSSPPETAPPGPRSPIEPDPASAPPRPRSGRRRLVVAAAAAVLLAAAALTVIGLALGADALLVTAVLTVAVLQCVVLAGIVHAVRLLRDLGDDRADEQLFRKQVRRRTNRLVRLSEEQLRVQQEDLATLQKARNEVAGVRKRVMAVGKLLARAGAAARDDAPSP